MRALVYAVIAGGLLGGGAAIYHASTTSTSPPVDAPPPRLARTLAVTDQPIPESRSLEAVAAYRAALQATRDGSTQTAITSLRRAVELDPGLGSAWMRLAELLSLGPMVLAREAYAHATTLRAAMTPRDRAYLAALEPIVVWPVPDAGEARRRFDGVARDFPDDAEVAYAVGRNALVGSELERAQAALERAVALDPQFAGAWMMRGWLAEARQREPEAREAFARCVAITPAASGCIGSLALLDAAAGRCADLAKAAERLSAANPDSPAGPMYASYALTALAATPNAMREGAEREAIRTHDPIERAKIHVRLALWLGDFAAVDDAVRAAGPATDLPRNERGFLVLAQARARLEQGDRAEAARLATAFLNTREPTAELRLGATPLVDPIPALLALALDAGALSADEVDRTRATWRAQWLAHDLAEDDAGDVWLELALTARTPAQAELAIAQTPRRLPNLLWSTGSFRARGNVAALTDRFEIAIPDLRREVASCLGLVYPYEHVRSRYQLGRALEQTNDVPGACAAYRFVVDRWGAAKPRSLTAEAARARIAALRCAP